MSNEMQMLGALLGQHGRRKRDRVLETFAIPKESIQEFMALAQRRHDTKANGVGSTAAHFELWQFVSKVIPYTKNKQCNMDLSNATAPRVQIVGNDEGPQVGKNGVLEVIKLPIEHVYHIYELMDLSEKGPMHQYNLWAFIEKILPAVRSEDNWALSQFGHDLTLIRKEQDENDN